MDIKEESILGINVHRHWYYVSKGRAMLSMLRGVAARSLIDVGAGSGVFTKIVAGNGAIADAVCVDPEYQEERDEIHAGVNIAYRREVYGDSCYDMALMMDVLEHVDDDAALLREYADRVVPGGHILITVPAFRFLWSGHDVFLEHRRRYTARQVGDLVRGCGLEVVRINYFFGLLFPVVACIRLLRGILLGRGIIREQSDLREYPALLNSALIGFHDIERALVFPVNRIAGLSVFCLCRKP